LSAFQLRPSPRLAALLVVLHLAAAGAAAAVVPGAPGLALGIAIAALGGASAWRVALLRGPRSLRAVELAADTLALSFANGAVIRAKASERRYVSRFLVAVPVRGTPLRTVFVTADMLDRESFRQLRLWALWGRTAGVAPKPLAG